MQSDGFLMCLIKVGVLDVFKVVPPTLSLTLHVFFFFLRIPNLVSFHIVRNFP